MSSHEYNQYVMNRAGKGAVPGGSEAGSKVIRQCKPSHPPPPLRFQMHANENIGVEDGSDIHEKYSRMLL